MLPDHASPAFDGPAGGDPARVGAGSRDGGKRSVRWVRFAIPVESPAFDGLVDLDPAGVVFVGGDGGERSVRWVCLALVVLGLAEYLDEMVRFQGF